MVFCWLAYMSSYVGRYNYSAVIVGIIDDGLLTRTEAGLISSVFFFAYMIGQIIHAFWIIRVNPVRVIPCAMLASAVLNILFISAAPGNMWLFWLFNGLVQSILWPCIVRVLTEYVPAEKVATGMVRINTSTAVGTALAYIVSTICLHFGHWRVAFIISAIMMSTMAVIWIFNMAEAETMSAGKLADGKTTGSFSVRQMIPIVLTSGFLLMLFASMCNGFLKDGIVTWVPTYIQDSYHIGPSYSTAFSILIPAAQFIGPLFVQIIRRRIQNPMSIAGILYGISAVFIACIRLFPGQLIVSCICFIICSMIMTGVNTALISLYPLRYKNTGMVAPVSSIANTCVYIGSMIASYVIGSTSESAGWGAVIVMLIFVSAAACIISICSRRCAGEKAGKTTAC